MPHEMMIPMVFIHSFVSDCRSCTCSMKASNLVSCLSNLQESLWSIECKSPSILTVPILISVLSSLALSSVMPHSVLASAT